ncbi:MAG: hypothetical protein KBT30_02315 [Clostridiales bacterium]|nr:hypothetical protein [Candidatus Apopatousia equi]
MYYNKGMVYITGDTHGLKDTGKFNSAYFLKHVNKPGNIVIITGDSGITWNKKSMADCIEFYSKFKCMFLFVDGNNDNFDILNKLPVENYCGGKVHRVSTNLVHLMRGEIFDLEGHTYLAFGGADSWDRYREFYFEEDKDKDYRGKGRRNPHINWWKEERPSKEEFENAIKNLEKHNNKVDVILTHETRTDNIKNYFDWSIHHITCRMLDYIYRKADFKHWYFGHHHYDVDCSKVETCMFNNIIKVENLDKI